MITPQPPRDFSATHDFSVSELAYLLKSTVESLFGTIRVRGEISGAKRHTSGHTYFRLKDTDAVIDAVMWRGIGGKLGQSLEDGMDVICIGKLTTYPGGSRYQIVVETVELAGEGALLKLLEQRRKTLAAEGLFAEERKKPLPFLPTVIGVVTSPTGAVIKDILHRLQDRFPCHVLVWPVAVQGDKAAEQVAYAIAGFNSFPFSSDLQRPDVLIIARGGGSLEDLWAFNEEIVVRAIAQSTIPVISAIGHETDVTLADFAADRRAPTPTAAAEMAVPVRLDLVFSLRRLEQRLRVGLENTLYYRQKLLSDYIARFPTTSRLFTDKQQRLDDWGERLLLALRAYMKMSAHHVRHLSSLLKRPEEHLTAGTHRLLIASEKLKNVMNHSVLVKAGNHVVLASKLLESFSFKSVLARGFSYVTDAQGTPLKTRKQAHQVPRLDIHFHDGILQAIPLRGTPQKRPKTTTEEASQETLLQDTLFKDL